MKVRRVFVTAPSKNVAGLRHKLNPLALRFLALFLSTLGCYYVLTLSPFVDRYLIYSTLEWTADAAGWLLSFAGGSATVHGVTIQTPDFAIRIQRGCDPLEPIILFGAAVIAFRAPLRKKLSGILVGGLVLFALNLIRILSLCWTTRNYPGWFETVHQEWWPALFIILSLVLWVVWIRWAQESCTNANA
jgi:exosortase/archaeosortase family protein